MATVHGYRICGDWLKAQALIAIALYQTHFVIGQSHYMMLSSLRYYMLCVTVAYALVLQSAEPSL